MLTDQEIQEEKNKVAKTSRETSDEFSYHSKIC